MKESGIVIGIDMTDEMLQRARNNTQQASYSNVEQRIPVDDNTVDVAISNCVINLTIDETSVFKEIDRILKNTGRMGIADLVTCKEVDLESINSEDWCDCIDGAQTKEPSIASGTLDSIK